MATLATLEGLTAANPQIGRVACLLIVYITKRPIQGIRGGFIQRNLVRMQVRVKGTISSVKRQSEAPDSVRIKASDPIKLN